MHEIAQIPLDPLAPLIIVDVDEVLAMFMLGFDHFVARHGYEMRVTRFALFENVYPPGSEEPIGLETGKTLFEGFFRDGAEHMQASPGAATALARLAQAASVVILSNAPDYSGAGRRRWLDARGFPYPMLLNSGPKGPAAAALAARTAAATVFIDDLLPNLDSVEADAPDVRRFQMVADPRLRPLAYSALERHPRHDDWIDLEPAIAKALGITLG